MERITEIELDKKRIKIAISLYRNIFWADTLRKQFEAVLARDRPEMEHSLKTKQLIFKPQLLESEMYLCLWFGCLYSVIEAWPNLKIDEPRLNKLLDEGYKNKLHDFRNATFHSTDFDDQRIDALAKVGQKSIDWARNITNEFKTFLESLLSIIV